MKITKFLTFDSNSTSDLKSDALKSFKSSSNSNKSSDNSNKLENFIKVGLILQTKSFEKKCPNYMC